MSAVSYVYAVGALFCNGTFVICVKVKSVADSPISPLIFNVYFALGVLLSSLLFAFAEDSGGGGFSNLGAAFSGAVLMTAITLNFAAIRLVGVAIGQSIVCGSAIITSYAFGVAAFDHEVASTGLACVAIGLLICGVVVISAAESIALHWAAHHRAPCCNDTPDEEDHLLQRRLSKEGPQHEAAAVAGTGAKWDTVRGMSIAAATGLFGGSVLVPFQLLQEEGDVENRGDLKLGDLPSFGLGAAATGLAFAIGITLLEWLRGRHWRRSAQHSPDASGCGDVAAGTQGLAGSSDGTGPPQRADGPLYLRHNLLPGLVAGVVWNAGNVLSILATNDLSYAVAYPLFQSSLFVAGLWGIFLFGELPGKAAQATFAVGGAVLITGAALLAVFA